MSVHTQRTQFQAPHVSQMDMVRCTHTNTCVCKISYIPKDTLHNTRISGSDMPSKPHGGSHPKWRVPGSTVNTMSHPQRRGRTPLWRVDDEGSVLTTPHTNVHTPRHWGTTRSVAKWYIRKYVHNPSNKSHSSVHIGGAETNTLPKHGEVDLLQHKTTL